MQRLQFALPPSCGRTPCPLSFPAIRPYHLPITVPFRTWPVIGLNPFFLWVLSRMLDVGLIGLGPEWEHRYKPALFNLRHRMRIRAVQTAVESLADQTAAEWDCQPAHGILSVIDRLDVRALLILDTAWYGSVPAEFACRRGKPAFLAGRLADWVPRAPALLPLAAETETPLMPDFGERYTPATSRLKELIATRLGRPESVTIEVQHPPADMPTPALNGHAPHLQRDVWLSVLDWACHLIGTAPAEIRGTRHAADRDEVTILFTRSAAGGAPATARLVVPRNATTNSPWTVEIRCRKGNATLQGGTEIAWENGEERRSESLAGERGGVEVMLDHFSRRVVGGLIPVPTLDDLCLAARLADAAEESCCSGRTIVLS